MTHPTVTITPEAMAELLDEHYEATRDLASVAEMLTDAEDEIRHLRYEGRVFRDMSIWFGLALAVSIIGHILRSAV